MSVTINYMSQVDQLQLELTDRAARWCRQDERRILLPSKFLLLGVERIMPSYFTRSNDSGLFVN